MKIILNLIRKEFIQIFRNRVMLPFIFIVPVVQLIVLVYAANLEMKSIEFFVVDNDLSALSRRLTSEFNGSDFFVNKGNGFSIKEAEELLAREKIDMILHFPSVFEKEFMTGQNAEIQLIINAVNATEAGLINAYSTGIISSFNNDIRFELTGITNKSSIRNINISKSFWYNPELNYKIFMLPGILVILVTIIGMFLTALNLVREKELGTSEQINVTPVKKSHFIVSKFVPFWIIALFELGFGLILGKLLFDLPTLGSISLLFGFASVYLLVILGIGLFLSTISSNQQQVMFLTFFFMLTFILMSGIFTPVESMPYWAQKVNIVNPFAYFMKVIRMILLKGSQFRHIQHEFFSLLIYGAIIMALSVWRYRKTV